MKVQRIHITGGPGAGKTTLAKRLGTLLRVPVYDQDGEALAVLRRLSERDGTDYRTDLAPIVAEFSAAVGEKMDAFAVQESWISEGSSLMRADSLFERADFVVLMDTTWPVAAYRIVLRHAKAEIARDNRFPGWLRMYRFCRYAVRYYRGHNKPGLNDYGVPRNNDHLYERLLDYQPKLVVCRHNGDVEALLRRIVPDSDG
jgi:hypothetical protein